VVINVSVEHVTRLSGRDITTVSSESLDFSAKFKAAAGLAQFMIMEHEACVIFEGF
jgi:hypothetical protein